MRVELHTDPATGAFGRAPYGATNRVWGVPKWLGRRHVDPAMGAVGEAPWGATNRVRGVPKWSGRRHVNPCHLGIR